MSTKFVDIGLVVGLGGMIIIIIALFVYFLNKQGYDVNTVSESIKILTSDNDGNISILPNYLNDLQKQINDMRTQVGTTTELTNVRNNLNNLSTNINNIINGTTTLKNVKVNGTLTADRMTVLNMKTTGTPAPPR